MFTPKFSTGFTRNSFRSVPAKVAFFTLAASLLLAGTASAQCAVASTMATTVGTTKISVVKYLTNSAACGLTAAPGSNNVDFCFPSGTSANTVSSLLASAVIGASNPYCNWVCNCGTASPAVPISINTSDGLPVELMEFSIDDDSEESTDPMDEIESRNHLPALQLQQQDSK